jgi:hypothetical protein
MDTKTMFLILALAIVMAGLSGYFGYQLGEKNEQLVVFRSPTVYDTTWKHDTLWLPVQHMHAHAMPVIESSDSIKVPKSLLEPARVILQDTLGGVHTITYVPMSREFSEDFLPPPRHLDTVFITSVKSIPVDDRPWYQTPLEVTGGFGVGILVALIAHI